MHELKSFPERELRLRSRTLPYGHYYSWGGRGLILGAGKPQGHAFEKMPVDRADSHTAGTS